MKGFRKVLLYGSVTRCMEYYLWSAIAVVAILGYSSTSQVIDPALGACFIPNIILLTLVVPCPAEP